MPWRFRLVERQRGYMFLDPTSTRTAAQLGAPAAKKKSYQPKSLNRAAPGFQRPPVSRFFTKAIFNTLFTLEEEPGTCGQKAPDHQLA